ncbi:hypothetical protein HN371_18925 [Candidatus Poribacteria bacterium]|jgi:hypothetical protein|nr:hypothetical protein [Candidatus Poribacteria bacterium]MBT5532327.1 hypothetical protein [Candidatus Poribacteria bacterium]MBT5712246.1 hypothetical protein [Candidatus Poribacteria bacterium]MBT7098689.1 hypothetical protein [Candidatus Poribacteria bacterium]MBT7804857.1 hypothetical protein [Candidatus Poribacteria bacterium]
MQVALSPRRRLGSFRLGETIAHQIRTGFWNMWQTDITEFPTEFGAIWDGVGGGDFAACDSVYFAFGDTALLVPAYWGHERDGPPSSFTWAGNPSAADRAET